MPLELSELVHVNPKLALACRLATYFEHYPIHEDDLGMGDALLMCEELIAGDAGQSTLRYFRDGGVYYTNSVYCLSCGVVHTELTTFHHSGLTPICSLCSTSEGGYLEPYKHPYYNPMQLLVKYFI
jgi:hypothetical protein